MADVIQIAIEAIDKASSVFEGIVGSLSKVDKATIDVNKTLEQYGAATDKVTRIQNELAKATLDLSEASTKLAQAQQILASNTDPAKFTALNKEVVNARVELDSAGKKVQDLTKDLKENKDASEGGAKGFESFAGKLVAVQAGIGVAKEAIAGLKEVWDFAKEGAANQQIAASFERTAKSIGANAADIVKRLDATAKGTIDDENLMQASTRALTLGVAKSGDDLVNVMRVARGAALQFGGDTGTAFENINYAIGNLAPRALKQYGIIINLSDAYKEYAKSIGISVDALTEEQQRQALLNAVLAQGAKNFGDVSDAAATTAEKMKAVETHLANITDSVKEFIATGFATAFQIDEGPRDVMQTFVDVAKKMRDQVLAGTMTTNDYNKAIEGIALHMRDAGFVMRQVDLDAQKLNDVQVIQGRVMGAAANMADALAKAIDGVALANKNAAAAVEANKPTDLSAMTPEAQQAATTAYKSFQSKISDIEVKGDEERVKVVGQAMDELAKLETDAGQKRADIVSQFTADEASRLSDMNDKRINILMSYADAEAKITESQNQARLKLAQSYGAEVERMEQDHQTQMKRMGEDHTSTLRKLADSRDALGIEDEMDKYRTESRRAEEDYQKQASRKNEDYARQLADQNAAAEEQRKAAKENEDKQLADLQKQFEKQDTKYKATYDKQLKDLDKATKDQSDLIWAAEEKKMSDLATAQAAEVTAANAEWTTWRNEHSIFFANEKTLYDDYLKHMHDQLQAYINNAGSAPTAAPVTTPTHAPGAGYAAGASFTVPSGYANDTYPMRVSSGEHVQITPGGKGSIPPIVITQTFQGAQSTPEQYKSIMYQVIVDVVEKAMRQ